MTIRILVPTDIPLKFMTLRAEDDKFMYWELPAPAGPDTIVRVDKDEMKLVPMFWSSLMPSTTISAFSSLLAGKIGAANTTLTLTKPAGFTNSITIENPASSTFQAVIDSVRRGVELWKQLFNVVV